MRNGKKSICAVGRFLLAAMLGLFLCGCGREQDVLEFEGEDSAQAAEAEPWRAADGEQGAETGEKPVGVHVCGAVRRPGLFFLPEGSRVDDAVRAAGGFREDADQEYLNLAAYVEDGEQLEVPTRAESEALRMLREEAQGSLVNINTADVERLCTLPGIGESRASDIVSYREEFGAFQTPEDIKKVAGIKESLYNKIKDSITVGGP